MSSEKTFVQPAPARQRRASTLSQLEKRPLGGPAGRLSSGLRKAARRKMTPQSPRHEGDEVFSWLRRRGKPAEQIEAEAAALIASNPVTAQSEAGLRRQDGEDGDVFAQWDRVMRKVALLTQGRTGPHAATGTADEGVSAPLNRT